MGLRDYTDMLVSIVLGILSIAIVFLLGREMFDTETGLVAAAVLAVSGYHLYYSRFGGTDASLASISTVLEMT